jgi:hypothetical protein
MDHLFGYKPVRYFPARQCCCHKLNSHWAPVNTISRCHGTMAPSGCCDFGVNLLDSGSGP